MGEALKTEDLWNPYKELQQTVLKHLSGEHPKLCNSELESLLRKHKQNFFALLQNPPKNAKSREELKKGMVEGIVVRGVGHQVLSKELYQEAIILSDMFDMNEFVALDLLCTAQMQMSYHPGLARGLVAVLLYYDGRKALLSALRCLIQARSGVQWSINVKDDLVRFITLYTDQLMNGGLFDRIFELLRTLDLSKEIDKLHQNVALGGPRHRKQVSDLFTDVRNLLAEIVFLWATQCGLPKSATVSLINYLREVSVEEEASGTLDQVSLFLQMGLLSALDLSILHTREDGEEIVQSLPLLSDREFLGAIVNEFAPTKPKWLSPGLQGISTLGLSVCLASLRLISQNQQLQDFIGREESFVDKAIELNVFEFLHNTLLESKLMYSEEFMFKRMHNLLTDFIVCHYPKVKELRIKADEIARTVQVYAREGLEAPVTLPKHFEYLLLSLAKFYHKNSLKNEFVLDYWSPIEINPNQSYSYRAPPRSVSLFKFVRFAGDMLPATLFVPYVTLLSGLSTSQQAARNCFNMLKQVGLLLSSTISWDHFFMSFAQYYNSLRQEVLPTSDTVYGQNAYKSAFKIVSPGEIRGLQAVLTLIRTVAEQDDFSRLALCEHPGWAPLTVLLGLVGCSVPIPLKAELLLTLAALSKSPENAAQMWENLEASQILVTVPTTSSYHPRGIQTELDEVESREEEYPLTRALLKLMDSLTDVGIPRTLGAGPRNPGFDPYLAFIVNSVFLKYNSRAYKNVAEKWEIAAMCLKLFDKFLKQYDPQATDFTSATAEFNHPPGYHLMIQLNNKTELLNLILDIIHEGCRMFDTFTAFPGEAMVTQCTLHCLNIIHRALVLQPVFFTLSSTSTEAVLLTSITKLLVTINRRSGKPDHCINIAKFVNTQYQLPEHAFSAIRILNVLFSSPVNHNHFTNILFSLDDVSKQVKSGFIECLDVLFDEDDSKTWYQTKLEILKLLKQCIVFGAPNFSHFLLGFDIKKDVAKSDLQMPGVLDYPRSSLHSMFGIMNAAIYNTGYVPDSLLESTYNLLFILCSNVKTSGPVLRFVKMNENFFITHMQHCCKKIQNGLHNMNQMSWLMKTVAIDLKVSSRTKQVKYLRQLTNFLIGMPKLGNAAPHDTFTMTQNTTFQNQFTLIDFGTTDYFLLNLIKYFDSKEDEVEMPQWEIFNPSVLQGVIKSCQSDDNKMIDLKKLHHVLNEELRTLQGTAIMSQIQAINQEVPKVLKYALEHNKVRQQCNAIVHFVDAWRQIVEVIVIYVPSDIVSNVDQQYFSIHLLLNLLRRILKVDLLNESCKLLSGAILLMLDKLRKCHLDEKKARKLQPSQSVDNSLDILLIHADALKEILKHLIEWIMVSNVTSEKLRMNIYASLVTFLELTNINEHNEDLTVLNSTYVSRLDSSRFDTMGHETKTLQIPVEIITRFGEKMVEVLCHDCIGGHEMVQVLALSTFGHLIQMTGNVNWVNYMSGRGYLKHIIQSILHSDNDLKAVLDPSPSNLRPMFLFAAKISFLIKIASSRVGAELLLEQKLLSCLSNMKVFSQHPEISQVWDANENFENFLPPLEEQYLQLWLPTLDICNAVLTTLGSDNKSAVVQIMHFVLNHLDVIELVLRSGSPSLPPKSLKELALVTFILARTANNDLVNILDNPNIAENHRTQLFRIQKLMLGLLPKFLLSDAVVRDLIRNPSDDFPTYQTSKRLLHAMQVICNLLFYATNLVANHGIDHSGVGVIFDPTLSTFSGGKSNQSFYEQTPSLGIIVQQLIFTVNYQHQEKVTLDLLVRKLKDIPDMSSVDLREFVDSAQKNTNLIPMRDYIYEKISDRLEKKRKEIRFCGFIIEHCMYLVWVHLDYYMLKTIPRAKHFGPNIMNSSINLDDTLASAAEATWKISTDDISQLKQGLVSIFNDSFTKQLLETSQDLSESDKGLAEALLRKIKRLIQFVPVK